MVDWWWLIVVFYAGVVFGFMLLAVLAAAREPEVGDEAEEWLRTQVKGEET